MNATFDRFQRQESLVPRGRLTEFQTSIIGVGAIGRQVALQLAAVGVPKLQLVDFDKVEATNVTTQGYLHEDIDRAKVDATASAIWQIDPRIEVDVVEDRFRPQLAIGDAVFCCVDSIEARSAIWRTAGRRAQFWCDGRMLGEVMRILAVTEQQGSDYYPTTLFASSEAQSGSCTTRGIIFTACIAAGLMTHQFTRWLRGLPIDLDLSLNLLASEFSVADTKPPAERER